MDEDWPVATREVHLLGGGVAINTPEEKNKVVVYPNTLEDKVIVLTIEKYSKLFLDLKKINIEIIGTEFYTHVTQLDGRSPSEWRAYTNYKKNWSIKEASWQWSNISNEAYTIKNGHMWDISSRIARQINTLSETFKGLSYSYRHQLNAKMIDRNYEVGHRFEDGFTSKIYDNFQHFLFDSCILRDYFSEFIFHYLVPEEQKENTPHMTTTSKYIKNSIKILTLKLNLMFISEIFVMKKAG